MMSIDNVQNRSSWDNTLYSGRAATFGSQSAAFSTQAFDEDFEETLSGSSVGFGSRNESGALTSSIAAVQDSITELISKLQYSKLVNDGNNGLASRFNNALF